MMTKVFLNIFLLFQLTINLFECFVDTNPEHSVETCFTADNQPAFCVDQSLCLKIGKSDYLTPLESCPKSEKVCCPLSNEAEHRDAFVVPSGLAWDWTQTWPNMPWAIAPHRYPTTTKSPPVVPVAASNSTAVTPNAAPPAAPNPNQQGCGARNLGTAKDEDELGFIVGGEVARANSWPWAVAMNSSGRFVCGATVIDSRHVLCAAHCVSHSRKITKADQIKVLLGAHNRYKSGEYYGVEKVIVHSGYNETIMQNDISIFKLDRAITFSKTVSPICLPKDCDQCPDSKGTSGSAYLAGWGTTSAGGSVSNELRDVVVPIIPLETCQKKYDSTMVTSNQICAGVLDRGGKDTCQGDSGGMMAMKPEAKENKHVQCGIVSWGKGCADGRYPGVYTKVCKFLSWIRDNTKN